jgi:hypothetical protein
LEGLVLLPIPASSTYTSNRHTHISMLSCGLHLVLKP